MAGGPGDLGVQPDEVFAVVHKFINRLVHIGQCRVFLLFFESVENLGPPAPRQLFQGADVQITVMQISFELGHELDQKAAVLADGVAAQR